MRPLKILAAAGVLAASATMTFAAPMSRSYDDGPVVQVQERCHSDCRRHGGDWIAITVIANRASAANTATTLSPRAP